ncbi:hypothetical protein CDL12_23693 [Handroanthus impetiginosus]|uniref:Phytocyanin domain-containing protein n=1 Tax=Handroanthus impetiginosus TaxID=429701 RepID=A0A2G9GFI9_9LAMI|nr:hypothetical protein CDL12_23693 [Handroanthus impetiginosus]
MAIDYQRYLFVFLALFSSFTVSSYANQLTVGGKDGWVVNPSENYNQWAQRLRFQVNDTLLFKYKKGSDSVLVVNKDNYDKCNTTNPILKLDDGNSVFKFDRSGPFYFISGNKQNCDQGQKLTVVVLAVRNRPTLPPHTPSPTATPPSPAGGAPSPSSSGSPLSPSPAGGAPAPTGSPPSPSPAGGAPTPAGTPSSPSPSPAAGAPTPSARSPLSPSPGGGGAGAPAPGISPPSPSPAGGAPSPSTGGPGLSPAATPPGTSSSPSSTPGTGGSPGSPSGTPADVNTPPGGSPQGSLAAPCSTPSIVLVSTVTLVLSVGLGDFIISP